MTDTVPAVENIVVDVTSIHREHFARHPLVALVPPLAIFEEVLAGAFDRYLVRGGAIGSSLHLTFNVDAEGVSGFLVSKVLALSGASIVGISPPPMRSWFHQAKSSTCACEQRSWLYW